MKYYNLIILEGPHEESGGGGGGGGGRCWKSKKS